MNGLGKPFRKAIKMEKNIGVKLEQIIKIEKTHFCSNTVFSLYFKIREKKFHAAKLLFFVPLFVVA